MAVSPAPGDPGRTLWRERLVIGGAAAPALWPVLWAVWQWRAARLRSLARTWAYDPPVPSTTEAAPGAGTTVAGTDGTDSGTATPA